MILLQMRKLLPAIAIIALGLAVWIGCQTANTAPALAAAPANGLAPGPNDPRITYWTARLLQEFHYLQRPLDLELSGKFFDGYVDSLDPRHENFLQSDLAEFSAYRTNLDLLTIGTHGAADLTPAFEIYQRYLKRFNQHAAYVDKLLKQDRFKFTADERIQIDRHEAPFPKNLSEAEQLWRQRLHYLPQRTVWRARTEGNRPG